MKDEVQKDFKLVKTNSALDFLKVPPRRVLFLIKSKVDRLLPAFFCLPARVISLKVTIKI